MYMYRALCAVRWAIFFDNGFSELTVFITLNSTTTSLGGCSSSRAAVHPLWLRPRSSCRPMPLSCLKWCNKWTCDSVECLGCNQRIGCVRPFPPPPVPPHHPAPPRGPGGCKFKYQPCLDAPKSNPCCDPGFGCFKRYKKTFAMCRPLVEPCVSDRKSSPWQCPNDWFHLSPSPPPPLPPPPPPHPPCSADYTSYTPHN